MDPKEYYSESYEKARDKFVSNTKDMRQSSVQVLDDMHIDVAESHPEKKRNLLVIVSGTHGVEGYVGSAFQLMFKDKFYDWVKGDVGVAMIHALNPYGFKHNRRFNENNVDLNRAFKDKKYEFGISDKETREMLDEIIDVLAPQRPRGNDFIETMKFYKAVTGGLARNVHRFGKLCSAVASGQYRYPQGLYFGGRGDNLEKSVKFFKRFITDVSDGYDNLFLFDIHTGLGRWGELFCVTEHYEDSRQFEILSEIIPTLKSDKEGRQYETRHYVSGSIEPYIMRHSMARNLTATVTVEFGTASRFSEDVALLKLLNLLVAENQVYHHSGVESLETVQARLKEGFYPSDDTWRRMVMEESIALGESVSEFLVSQNLLMR